MSTDEAIEGFVQAIAPAEGSKEPKIRILCPNCSEFVDITTAEKETTPGTQMFITVKCPNCNHEFMATPKPPIPPRQRTRPYQRPSISRIHWRERNEDPE